MKSITSIKLSDRKGNKKEFKILPTGDANREVSAIAIVGATVHFL